MKFGILDPLEVNIVRNIQGFDYYGELDVSNFKLMVLNDQVEF